MDEICLNFENEDFIQMVLTVLNKKKLNDQEYECSLFLQECQFFSHRSPLVFPSPLLGFAWPYPLLGWLHPAKYKFEFAAGLTVKCGVNSYIQYMD